MQCPITDIRRPAAALAAALLLLALSSVSLAAGHGREHGPRAPSVSVTGEGQVTALPDRAALQLGVQARHSDLASARADVTRRSNAVLAHLQTLGIDERQVNATHINAQPEYRWDKDREEQVLTGYSVQRSIEVVLLDLSQLPAVIEGSADAGANQVSPPQLSHSREAELQRDALRLATEDARANAQAIAESLGTALDGIRDISSTGGLRPMPVANDMMLRASMESADPEARYVAGDMVFEARVSATFFLSAGGDADGV